MGVQRMRLVISKKWLRAFTNGHTLRSSDDDGSTLGDVGDSSSGQEEGTVLLISIASFPEILWETYDVGLHGPVKLLGSDVGDRGLVVLLVSSVPNSRLM